MKFPLSTVFIFLNLACYTQQVKSLLVSQYYDRTLPSVSILKDTILYQEWYSNGQPKIKFDTNIDYGCKEKSEYDSIGRILKKVKKCEKYTRDCTYTYDSLIRKKTCSSKFNSILIDSFSQTGKIVQTKYQYSYYNRDSVLQTPKQKWKYFYDLNDNLIFIEEYAEDKLYIKTSFEYNTWQNLIHKSVQYPDTFSTGNHYFAYDSNNRIVRANIIRGDGPMGFYLYDSIRFTYKPVAKKPIDKEIQIFNDTLIKYYCINFYELLIDNQSSSNDIRVSNNIESILYMHKNDRDSGAYVTTAKYFYDKKNHIKEIKISSTYGKIININRIIKIEYSKNQIKITEQDLFDPKNINEKITLYEEGKIIKVIKKNNDYEQIITSYHYKYFE